MEFYISGARLSQIENGSTVPSIYKLATLSRIYGVKYSQFLRAYGIETDATGPRTNPSAVEPTQVNESSG
ncbi:MAG: helix-turn-helix transcriptional regulator, partial [Acidobacteria bacterium]|nr:helix-turn-helix transcriptional regulator [Acidobacteriota bacterium]